MSSMNMTEALSSVMPMVIIVQSLSVILSLLPLVISIVTLVLVVKIYKRK